MIRWLLAVLVLLGTATVTAISALTQHLRVCEQVVAQVGDQAVTQSCRPTHLTDPAVVLAAAVAVFLLLPDLRRLNVAGLFEVERIERRVDEQQRQTEELWSQVTQLRVASTQMASQQVVVQQPMLLPEAVSLPSDDELKRRMEAILRERP